MFFILMILNPDVQARAQAEIDEVTGGDRLPNFKDRGSLPYTEAVMWESLRWGPIGWLSEILCFFFSLIPTFSLSAFG